MDNATMLQILEDALNVVIVNDRIEGIDVIICDGVKNLVTIKTKEWDFNV